MRKLFLVLSVLIGCLLVCLAFNSSQRNDHVTYNGESIGYWEKQAQLQVPRGNEKVILPAVKKMGPEAIPFWLERMQARDSAFTRAYASFWSTVPNLIKARLPAPIPQRTRRYVAYFVLNELQFTNGIPELIQLSYSKDTELQGFAINLLFWRAYRFYRPSNECIAAFCSALQTGDVRTRVVAAMGLNVLPVRDEALGALKLALNDLEEEVRVNAATAILKLQPDSDVAYIFQAGIMSSNNNVRVISNVALSQSRSR